jgi:hypothetical protein
MIRPVLGLAIGLLVARFAVHWFVEALRKRVAHLRPEEATDWQGAHWNRGAPRTDRYPAGPFTALLGGFSQ